MGHTMLLTGVYHRTLDEKLRFALPKPLRDAIGHPERCVLYLTPGTDGSLELYTEDAFSALAAGTEQASRHAPEVRAFNRLFYAQVQRIELDRHGRVRLPAELAELVLVGKEIVLLGVKDHIELWDRGRWEAYRIDTQPHYDELAERAFPGVTRTDSRFLTHEEQQFRECLVGSNSQPTQPR
jgi:MraZ protein